MHCDKRAAKEQEPLSHTCKHNGVSYFLCQYKNQYIIGVSTKMFCLKCARVMCYYSVVPLCT